MDITNKIRKIEALIAGTKRNGERQAAEFAKQFFQVSGFFTLVWLL